MVMSCPYCKKELTGPIGPSCGSCKKDIRFMAAALSDGSAELTDEMKEEAVFQEHVFDDETFICEGDGKLEPGDLIEIFRGIYQHWAVYVGNGYVVHLVGPGAGSFGSSLVISSSTVAGEVRKDKLKDVVKSSKWKKNNEKHQSNMLIPRSKADIVKEALSRVGEDVNYKLTTSNCEHFATECRYGKAVCLQVEMGAVGSFAS